ncbi:hypothetical protein [Phenylobacterium sp.]|uniref:hypothetical protein n=1 Tax=Phenylobacterium sp. TaxID=1871053 RepID=UPI002734F309|nr:hypothetical protein [Phenylobacterium sp.]MDP3634401.1 hypothetical protein [Phenylobacterium sp.]HQT52142.1 hypothetical protein [Phenylobacterium sp.]
MSDVLARARDFLLRNGRLLERRLFEHHFDGASAEPVVRALAAYQGRDGGFGSALEPDKRDPASQPVDVQIAFEILDEVDAFDPLTAGRACDWLASIATPEGGLPFALPSVNAAPHAVWWKVEGEQPPADINPTAAIVGLLRKHGIDHPWAARGEAYCWSVVEGSETDKFHDLMPMICFLEHTGDRPRAQAALAVLAQRIPGLVELDAGAVGYVKKPLDWAPSPSSFCHSLFSKELLGHHLEALAARQDHDGGWPISWETVGPGPQLEYRGVMTVAALKTLKAYGAL